MSTQERLVDDALLTREPPRPRAHQGKRRYGLEVCWRMQPERGIISWYATAKQRNDAHATWTRRIGDFWTRAEKIAR